MSKHVIVVNQKFAKEFLAAGINVKTPMEFILDPESGRRKEKVFNLSSNMGYQEKGYYVSLLATARNNKILPSVRTIQDLNDRRINKVISEEISILYQHNLKDIKSKKFELSIYFGKNLATTYDKLSWELYRIIQAPMFRVYFENVGQWEIKKISLLSPSDINQNHFEFLVKTAQQYIESNRYSKPADKNHLYDLAILHNEKEEYPPSNKRAIKKFVEAFEENGFRVRLIQNSEKPDINNYDAIFIRETTNVTHHTYRIARNAQIEGAIVVDDPNSIVRCSNKVYLEQLLDRLKINRPKSIILDNKKLQSQIESFHYPVIIKQPDSAFSQGVHKANSKAELLALAQDLLKKTELLIIQDFVPTDFDWRIGILDGKVLYACKYYMARGHWQIINTKNGKVDEGGFECLNPKDVDPKVLKIALKVAKEIGHGLYGVDLKQKGDQVYFIEINDNPSIEAGVEDKFLGDQLYDQIAKFFLNECHKKRGFNAK